MHRLLLPSLALSLALAAPPVLADETDPPPSFEEGFSLLGEGMSLLMRALESEMAPMLESLGALIDDANAYERPEILENGDILIRRKVPLTPEDGIDPETGATDL